MNGKYRKIDQQVIDTYDDTTLLCFKITARQAVILSGQTDYIAWERRWKNLTYSPSELNEIRERIEAALITMEECEDMTSEEICAIVAQCQTILDMQADISLHEGEITQNAIAIGANASNITALQNDVSINAGAIQDNADDIINLQFDAAQQAALITNNISRLDDIETLNTAQQAELDDHETRITALENSSGGSGDSKYVLIDSWIAEDDTVVQQPLLGDGANYRYWKVVFSVACVDGGGRFLDMRENEDDTAANYSSSFAGNYSIGRIANSAAVADDMRATGEIIIHRPQDETSFKTALSTIKFQDSQDGNFWISDSVHTYESLDAIEKLRFSISGSGKFAQGSKIELYGFIDDTPQVYDWQAKLNFTSNPATLPITHNGVWNSGGGYIETTNVANVEQATIILFMSQNYYFSEIGIEYYCSNNSSGSEINWFNNVETFVLKSPVIFNQQITEYFDTLALTDDIRITLTSNDPYQSGDGRIYSVTYRGTGTIPQELEPYEI